MAQITWRNINNPSFTGGNNLGEVGGDRIMNGLNSLASIVGNQEQLQKKELTDQALGQINQLDRSGLETAIQGNDFQGLGNVDQSAINKALKGRGKGIDEENDAKYAREELLSKRADQPILGAIELAMANNDYAKATELGATLSTDSGRARVATGIDLDRRSDRKIADEDALRTKRITNEGDVEFGNKAVADFLDKADAAQAEGNTVDATKAQFIEALGQRKSMDQTEISQFGKLFDERYKSRNTLSEEAQGQVDRDVQTQLLDKTEELNVRKQSYERAAAAVSGDALSSDQITERKKSLMNNISENFASDSWVPMFGENSNDEQAGSELKISLDKLIDKHGYDPAEVELAMMTYSQNKGEAWGNPEAYMDQIAKSMKDRTKNKAINKYRKVAMEIMNPNSKRYQRLEDGGDGYHGGAMRAADIDELVEIYKNNPQRMVEDVQNLQSGVATGEKALSRANISLNYKARKQMQDILRKQR